MYRFYIYIIFGSHFTEQYTILWSSAYIRTICKHNAIKQKIIVDTIKKNLKSSFLSRMKRGMIFKRPKCWFSFQRNTVLKMNASSFYPHFNCAE